MKFVVTQMGARRNYAVPLLLERAGMLERFYTDLAGNVGFGKWLVKCGRLLGFGQAAQRLRSRQIPEAIKPKTVAFGIRAFRRACKRSVSTPGPVERFREHLQWSRALGSTMVRRGFGQATHLYSMLGECAPVAEAAKRRGMVVVTEVYIMLSTERIVAAEQRRFPDLEEPSPDLDRVRPEFPEQEALMRDTDLFICPSPIVADDLTTNFGLGKGRTCIVPYGIDSRWLELPVTPVPGRVLFVGSAGLRKGLHYLAQAAELLHRSGRCYEFRIAGEVRCSAGLGRPQVTACVSEVAGQRAGKQLVLLGRVPRTRIGTEYSSADVFVLPSLAEGSAEATYEALASGLPVITTRASGSVVRHGVEGLIVPERDSTALAASIELIIEDRRWRQTLSTAARQRARDYTFERYGERLIGALKGFRP